MNENIKTPTRTSTVIITKRGVHAERTWLILHRGAVSQGCEGGAMLEAEMTLKFTLHLAADTSSLIPFLLTGSPLTRAGGEAAGRRRGGGSAGDEDAAVTLS